MANQNRNLSPGEVADRLSERPEVVAWARRVGRWVWVEFADDEKPDAATRSWLRELGFHFNKKRRAWQHPCGWFSKASTGDPRWKYGSTPLASSTVSRAPAIPTEEEQAA